MLSGTPMHSSLPFPGMKELNDTAKKRFNEPVAPQYFLFGYAWMQALQRGVEGAKSVNQDAIVNYLRSNEISTIGGKFKFDDKGLPSAYNYTTQVMLLEESGARPIYSNWDYSGYQPVVVSSGAIYERIAAEPGDFAAAPAGLQPVDQPLQIADDAAPEGLAVRQVARHMQQRPARRREPRGVRVD